MCGIAGRVGKKPLSESVPVGIAKALAHRGPDGFAAYSTMIGRLWLDLFFSRLAVIDLGPQSMQPISFDESTLIFNGEIYNYREVRSTLVDLGHTFLTSGDAEVLIHALREWGISSLDRLEGMWAFAWFDKRRQETWLSRDRFGEKPLYYYETDSELLFGSEPAVIAALLGEKLRINETQIRRYLVNGYKALFKDSDTYFQGLSMVEPGSWIRIDGNRKISAGRYWNLQHQDSPEMRYEDAVRGVRERLEHSVKLRLRADVPIAFCLSGGVDSNALAFLAKQLVDDRVVAFTLQTPDARYDESKAVSGILSDSGFDHTFVRVTRDDNIDRLKSLISHRQMPISTISYYIQSMMLRAMSETGVKVSVSGTAADELFTGYYDHHLFYLASIVEEPTLFDVSMANWTRYISGMVRNPYLKDPLQFVNDSQFRRHIYLNSETFGKLLDPSWTEEFHERKFSTDILRNRMLNELFAECVPVILMEDDFNAMAVSIENRSPFLDRELVEFSYSIPTRFLIRDGYSKAILRDAMKGVIPESIRAARKKVGFNASVNDLFDLRSDSVRDDVLSSSRLFDFIPKKVVEAIFNSDPQLNSDSKFLFNVICTAVFLESLST